MAIKSRANVWYFGKYAGVDFNTGSPVALTNGQMTQLEGCTAICDTNGGLVFYTDGTAVWCRNHLVAPNGTNLTGNSSSTQSSVVIPDPADPDNMYYIFTADYSIEKTALTRLPTTITAVDQVSQKFTVSGNLTESCTPAPPTHIPCVPLYVGCKITVAGSTGNDGIYTVVSYTFLPFPATKTEIVVAEAIPDATVGGNVTYGIWWKGYRFSKFYLQANSGYGDIILKNVPLITTPQFIDGNTPGGVSLYGLNSEKIAAIRKTGSNDYIVAMHGVDISPATSNKFYIYLVTASGISLLNQQTVGTAFSNRAGGYMKFSPDGTKLIKGDSSSAWVELYKFDENTGLIDSTPANIIKLTLITYPYGVEFSPDSSKLYVAETVTPNCNIYQYDLTTWDVTIITASKLKLCKTYPCSYTNIARIGALQLAPNEKIYVDISGNASNNQYLSVIANPDVLGVGCNYTENVVYLNTDGFGRQCYLGLPNFCTTLISDPSKIYGCTAPTAENYNPLATDDDGSCYYLIPTPTPTPTPVPSITDCSTYAGKKDIFALRIASLAKSDNYGTPREKCWRTWEDAILKYLIFDMKDTYGEVCLTTEQKKCTARVLEEICECK